MRIIVSVVGRVSGISARFIGLILKHLGDVDKAVCHVNGAWISVSVLQLQDGCYSAAQPQH